MSSPTIKRSHDGVTLLDPEFSALLDALPFADPDAESLPVIRSTMSGATAGFSMPADVTCSDHRVVAPDGHEVTLRVYRPDAGGDALPCIYAMHGGGFVFGSYDMLDPLFADWCPRLGVVGVSVEYRLAPEHPFPMPLEDCMTGLTWIHRHHDDFGIDPERVGVQGTSSGGGIAAALTLLNRDREAVPIAFQALECPMLDDRLVTASSNLSRLQVWSRKANEFGWRSYLGERFGTVDVPPEAAPARAGDLSGLPPALVCVGGADGFRDEDVAYALRLYEAGVSTELHVYPGSPHGGVQLMPDARASRQWRRDVESWLAHQLDVALPD
jgi:acetyl esterase/lipase